MALFAGDMPPAVLRKVATTGDALMESGWLAHTYFCSSKKSGVLMQLFSQGNSMDPQKNLLSRIARGGRPKPETLVKHGLPADLMNLGALHPLVLERNK